MIESKNGLKESIPEPIFDAESREPAIKSPLLSLIRKSDKQGVALT